MSSTLFVIRSNLGQPTLILLLMIAIQVTTSTVVGQLVESRSRSTTAERTNQRKLEVSDSHDWRHLQSQLHALVPRIQASVVSVEGGSGVIIESTGLVATASHVSKSPGRIVPVQFADGSWCPAVTLGTNRTSDLSALQLVGLGPWPNVELNSDRSVEVGTKCLAFGYPLAFPRGRPAPVRIGNVTAISENQIVSSCLIMGGDSGGPLVDLDGKVIGINSGVKSQLDQNLHVPANALRRDLARILAGQEFVRSQGRNARVYFGVQGETDRDRVRIRKVFKGSPAEKAGIRSEDVILQLDGRIIRSFSELLETLDQFHPGERVTARINRFGHYLDLEIQLRSR